MSEPDTYTESAEPCERCGSTEQRVSEQNLGAALPPYADRVEVMITCVGCGAIVETFRS